MRNKTLELYKLEVEASSMVADNYNPTTWEAESGESQAEG